MALRFVKIALNAEGQKKKFHLNLFSYHEFFRLFESIIELSFYLLFNLLVCKLDMSNHLSISSKKMVKIKLGAMRKQQSWQGSNWILCTVVFIFGASSFNLLPSSLKFKEHRFWSFLYEGPGRLLLVTSNVDLTVFSLIYFCFNRYYFMYILITSYFLVFNS